MSRAAPLTARRAEDPSASVNNAAAEFEEGKITVVVRCRPFNEREHTMRSLPCLDFQSDGQTLQIFERGVPSATNPDGDKGRKHSFTFDKSYHMQVSQESVYVDVGKPVLFASLKGFNTCIFAYGQTGSGKSFAMMGPAGGRDATKAPGIIPRLCTDLFQEVRSRLDANAESIADAKGAGCEEHALPPMLSISVDVSYLEIYQEKVKCLLDPKKDNLKVRQHPALGVYVDQLTEVAVHDFDKVMDLIEGGNNARHVASTNMNDRSSRSHAIFAILVTQKRKSRTKDGQENITEVKSRINLVDLAGSERAKSTGAEGDTLREGAQINRSLTVLGLVISGLAEQSKAVPGGKAPFIPYRDSALTFLLKESLGGNSKTYMLSTLSPAHINYEETLSTLRYADRAKAIVTKACINESAGDKKIRELEDEVSQLRDKLKEYQLKMEKQSEVAKVVPKLNFTGLGAQPSRGRAALSLTAAGGRGASGGRGSSYALVTPRSAINRVIESGPGEEGDGGYDEDIGNWMPQATPRLPSDVARLEERLHAAEALMERLTETDEHKEESANHIIEEMRQHKTVKASRADPHLLNLDADLVTEFVVEYLVDEVTFLGTSALEEPVLNSRCIVIGGEYCEGVGPQHCSFVRSTDGRVTLRPLDGWLTFLNGSDDPLTEDTVLQHGTVVSIGDSLLQFKFVDPSSSGGMTARRRGKTISAVRAPQQGSPSPPVEELQNPSPVVAAPPVVIPRLNLGQPPAAAATATLSPRNDESPFTPTPVSTPPPPPNIRVVTSGDFIQDSDSDTDQAGGPPPAARRATLVPALALGTIGAHHHDPNARLSQSSSDVDGDEEVQHILDSTQPPQTEKSPSPEKPAVPMLKLGGLGLAAHDRPPQQAQPTQGTTSGDGPSPSPPPPNVDLLNFSTVSRSINTARNTTSSIGTVRPASMNTARASPGRSSVPATIPTVVAFNEEVQAVFRHTLVLMGACGSGKTAFRTSLGMKDKWYSFFKKDVITTQPTYGMETTRLECGQLQRVELNLVELAGREPFVLLQPLLPERRVTYVLFAKLGGEPVSLATFRNYLEFILCQTTSSETSVMIVASHRDLAGTSSSDDRRVLELLQDLEQQIRHFFELLQPQSDRRPRVVSKFAVDNMQRTVLSSGSKMSKFSELLGFLGDHAVHRCRTDPDFPNCLVPTRLLTMSRKLLEIRAQGRWCLSSIDYKCLAKQCDVRYERSLEELHRHTQLLHSWGVVNHQYRHLLLKKTVVLDTTWVGHLICILGCLLPGSGRNGGGGYKDATAPLLQSADVDLYRDRLAFLVRDVFKVDPHGLCMRGLWSTATAIEMLRQPLREKGLSVRSVETVLELFENYDLIIRGNRLKQSCALISSSGASAAAGNASSPLGGRNASNTSFTNHDGEAPHGDAVPDDDAPQTFYLVPTCFRAQTPPAVAIHFPKLLLGPFYRFSLNMVPPFFFARFVSRVSRYCQRIYFGPVSGVHFAVGEDGLPIGGCGASVVGGQFWCDTAWIISSPTSRALARMVQHSLFITFHDASQDEEFHDGLRQVVRCLVSESPGMRCEEAILCRPSVDDSEANEEDCKWCAIDENINSLEKIREREMSALRSARAGPGRGGIAELMRRRAEAEAEGLPVPDEAADTPLPFIRPLDAVIDEAEVLQRITRDVLMTDDVLHRVERALKLIHRGQVLLGDRQRGSVIEGKGMDALIDALAQA